MRTIYYSYLSFLFLLLLLNFAYATLCLKTWFLDFVETTEQTGWNVRNLRRMTKDRWRKKLLPWAQENTEGGNEEGQEEHVDDVQLAGLLPDYIVTGKIESEESVTNSPCDEDVIVICSTDKIVIVICNMF